MPPVRRFVLLAILPLVGCGGSDVAPASDTSTGGMSPAGAAGAAGHDGPSGAAGIAGKAASGGGASGGASGKGGGGASAGGGASGASAGAAGNGGIGGVGGSASGGTSGASGSGTAGSGAAGSGTAGSGGSGIAALCQGVASASFEPPTSCNGPSGSTSKQVPSNHVYSTSWFGCYAKPDGTIFQDPTDNCQFACGPKGLCPAGQSGPECEAGLKWFSADADRYGCGARIRLTNCVNGKQVVVVALDRGPSCPTEQSFGVPVIDMSHGAMIHLFDGNEYGGSDKKRIVVEEVPPTTPLGPVL